MAPKVSLQVAPVQHYADESADHHPEPEQAQEAVNGALEVISCSQTDEGHDKKEPHESFLHDSELDLRFSHTGPPPLR